MRFHLKTKPTTYGFVQKLKARFVVRGFEHVAKIDFQKTFALTIKWATIWTIVVLAFQQSLLIKQLDVHFSFLNKNHLKEMFMV
jgi:hypothetical protein